MRYHISTYYGGYTCVFLVILIFKQNFQNYKVTYKKHMKSHWIDINLYENVLIEN